VRLCGRHGLGKVLGSLGVQCEVVEDVEVGVVGEGEAGDVGVVALLADGIAGLWGWWVAVSRVSSIHPLLLLLFVLHLVPPEQWQRRRDGCSSSNTKELFLVSLP